MGLPISAKRKLLTAKALVVITNLASGLPSQADVHGCLTRLVKTKTFQLKRDGYSMKLNVEGKIKEEGTGRHSGGVGSGLRSQGETLSSGAGVCFEVQASMMGTSLVKASRRSQKGRQVG